MSTVRRYNGVSNKERKRGRESDSGLALWISINLSFGKMPDPARERETPYILQICISLIKKKREKNQSNLSANLNLRLEAIHLLANYRRFRARFFNREIETEISFPPRNRVFAVVYSTRYKPQKLTS